MRHIAPRIDLVQRKNGTNFHVHDSLPAVGVRHHALRRRLSGVFGKYLRVIVMNEREKAYVSKPFIHKTTLDK